MVRGPVPAVFASYFVFIFDMLICCIETLLHLVFARGYLSPHNTAAQSEQFLYMFGTLNLALYALAPNHVFGQ